MIINWSVAYKQFLYSEGEPMSTIILSGFFFYLCTTKKCTFVTSYLCRYTLISSNDY